MFLSGTLDSFNGTLSPGNATYTTNGGSYWNALEVATHSVWSDDVYINETPDHSQYHLPGKVVANFRSTEQATLYVQETEQGPSGTNDPISAGSKSVLANESTQIRHEIDAKYVRVQAITGKAATANVNITVRLKDEH